MLALLNDISSEDWGSIAQMLAAVSVSSSAIAAAYTYSRQRKTEDAQWLQNVFEDFYLTDRFEEERYLMESGYRDTLEPILDRTWPDIFRPFTRDENRTIAGLDNFLNFLEWVLYLEGKGQIRKEEREHVLKWWFDVMREPSRGSLRYYLKNYGFELLASEVLTDSRDFLFVYGTLLTDAAGSHEGKPDLDGLLIEPTVVEVSGRMWRASWYPVITLGGGTVKGQLFEIAGDSRGIDPAKTIALLDRYEEFDPREPKNSEYLRRVIRVICPKRGHVDAWTYVWNRPLNGLEEVPSGDWLEFTSESRDSNPTI